MSSPNELSLPHHPHLMAELYFLILTDELQDLDAIRYGQDLGQYMKALLDFSQIQDSMLHIKLQQHVSGKDK
ncbi:hypothetical protein XSR1_430015 [Xenorhabdus szentirmaii DSM 16338]|uniref:Uncharacterized protein n=1 Tax=Xenorhabdus szentirmaii DSM 16338 TaxID=1427518 RepID=W1J0M2_9GAMM|nr:hypothetical protein XSR1_430015 [Xenorhabdus szentirmaii DSM 16338]